MLEEKQIFFKFKNIGSFYNPKENEDVAIT